ncbi:MAG TPA: dihydroorotase [Candidatus Latescibacteria bacterium]|nr:dihydroorotase [Candidatus Latescibacterota bacterium]
MRLILKNARIIDPASGFDDVADLWIEDGLIAGIGRAPFPGNLVDLEGKILAPGLIDMHVHLREPGGGHKETLATGAAAASTGGFTAVAHMPNTSPVVDTPYLVRWVKMRSRGLPARVYPIAAVTEGQKGKKLTDFLALKSAGVVALSDDGHPIAHEGVMRRALEKAREVGVLMILHEEDPDLSSGGVVDCRIAGSLGLSGIPPDAEERMVARDIALAEETGVPIHIAHVSTAGSVRLIREAKARGVPLTCETAPHYFVLTYEALIQYGTDAKMNPPLRSEEDRLEVLRGLADGTIDAIASDHAPHTPSEKARPLSEAPFGVVGLETALGVSWTELVEGGVLPPEEVLAKLSLRPARILGVPGGRIVPGAPADLTIVDPEVRWTVNPKSFHSKARNTPFAGRSLKGKAWMTILGGKILKAGNLTSEAEVPESVCTSTRTK